MISRTAFALAAAASLILVACGSDSSSSDSPSETLAPVDTSSPGSAVTSADLDGRTFEATAVEGHDLVAGSSIGMQFEGDRLSAYAGCNRMSGGYTLDGDALVAAEFAMTMMACDESLMTQESWVSTLLSSSPTISLGGETLTLTGEGGTITFVEVPDVELEGRTWNVTGTIANQGVSSVPQGASLTFADGSVAVKGGCNSGSGEATIGDGTITFGPIATTRMACEDALMELEAKVLAVLDGEVTYTVDGDTMVLTNADDLGLQLTAG